MLVLTLSTLVRFSWLFLAIGENAIFLMVRSTPCVWHHGVHFPQALSWLALEISEGHATFLQYYLFHSKTSLNSSVKNTVVFAAR